MDTARPQLPHSPRFGIEVFILVASILVSFIGWNRIQHGIESERGADFAKISELVYHAIEESIGSGHHSIDQIEAMTRAKSAFSQEDTAVITSFLTAENREISAIGVLTRVDGDIPDTEGHFVFSATAIRDFEGDEREATISTAFSDRIGQIANQDETVVGLVRADEEPLTNNESIVMVRPVRMTADTPKTDTLLYLVLSLKSVLDYARDTSQLQPGVGFRLNDSESPQENLEDSLQLGVPELRQFYSEKSLPPPAGTLTVHVWATNEFRLSPSIEQLSLVVLISGVMGGFMLFGITYMISTSAARAEKLAKDMTISLRNEIAVRKEAEESLKRQTGELAAMNKLMVGRELKMIELKKIISDLQEEIHRT